MNNNIASMVMTMSMVIIGTIASFKEDMVVSGLFWIAAAIFFTNISRGGQDE